MRWQVVQRIFCPTCRLREVNGPDADLCARCEGDFLLELEEVTS